MRIDPRAILVYILALGGVIAAVGAWTEVRAQVESSLREPTASVSFGATAIEVPDTLLAKHYSFPKERLGWRAARTIPDAEWPLLFEISRASAVDIAELVGMRQQKIPWNTVFVKFQFKLERLFAGSADSVVEINSGSAEDRFVDQAVVQFLVAVTKKPFQEVLRQYRATPKFVLLEVSTTEAERVAADLMQEDSRGIPKPLPDILLTI